MTTGFQSIASSQKPLRLDSGTLPFFWPCFFVVLYFATWMTFKYHWLCSELIQLFRYYQKRWYALSQWYSQGLSWNSLEIQNVVLFLCSYCTCGMKFIWGHRWQVLTEPVPNDFRMADAQCVYDTRGNAWVNPQQKFNKMMQLWKIQFWWE
jgi:hypothetical protein